MKIIIEKGDPTKLAPGIYEANESGLFVDCLGADEIYLKANVSINMNQKPKPVPAGGRYDFEFRKHEHEQEDADSIVFEAIVRDRIHPSRDYVTQRVVNRLMISEAGRTVDEVEKYVVTELIHLAVKRVVENLLLTDQFQGRMHRVANGQTGNSIEPPLPVATCDKTFADCRRHGNTKRYRGYVSSGQYVPCPYAFGDPLCTGVLRPISPPAMPDDYNNRVDPSKTFLYDLDVGDGAGADVKSDDGFISNVIFPKTAAERAQAKTKDCDECYGTGRFKGFGGPCSEGCPTKGEK